MHALESAAPVAATWAAPDLPWQAIGTVLSVLLAAASMFVALWQARIARRAAQVAQEAATAAGIQARATVEQANLLRRQLEAETIDRTRRDTPKFSVRAIGDDEWGTLEGRDAPRFVALSATAPAPVSEWFKRQTLELQMTEGPDEVAVELATVRPSSARAKLLGDPTLARLGFLQVEMVTPYELSGKQVVLGIDSKERLPGLSQSWQVHLSVTA